MKALDYDLAKLKESQNSENVYKEISQDFAGHICNDDWNVFNDLNADDTLSSLFSRPNQNSRFFNYFDYQSIVLDVPSTKTKSLNEKNHQEYLLPYAKLGEDCDLIFTLKDHVEEVKEWLKEYNLDHVVKVEPVEQWELMKNIPLMHAGFQVTHHHPRIVASDHLTLYPTITKIGTKIYQSPYPNGSERIHHGPPHAARVYLFANAIAEMYNEQGIISKKNPAHLLLSAYLHDLARKNDGIDLWDKESGLECKRIFINHLNCSEEESEYFSNCIAEKDSKTPFSLDQKIIHDADCMEIVRALFDPDCFQEEELWIFKELNKEDVLQFVQESKEWIALTERPMIKKWVAAAENPIKNLIQILEFANSLLGKFPLLARCTLSVKKAFAEDSTQYILTQDMEEEIRSGLIT